MALNLEQKKAVVADIAKVASEAHSAVAAEYLGLTVEEMTDLRRKAREGGVYLRVAKNTLVRRAVSGTSFECMTDQLLGPLVYAFSMEDPGSAARVVKDFAKDHNKLAAKVIAIDGEVFDESGLERLASLPTLDQARAIFLGVLKAPAEKLVRTLAEPQAKFVRLLAANRDKIEAA